MQNQTEIPAVEANASLVPPEEQRELIAVVQQNNLHADTALSLQSSFAPLFKQARDVIEKSRGIIVTDAGQKMEIAMARACRLQLKAIRVAGEKTRKEIKEESVRRGRAIDGFYSILEHTIASEETRLEQQEKFAEVQEANRRAALKSDREKILATIQVDPNLYALTDMSEQTFQQLVEGTKLARQADAERRRKEEADRIDREAKEQAERERIRMENERLKREAEEKDAAARLEREMAAKELKRLADEKQAAELKAKQEREAAAAETQRMFAEQCRIADEAAAKERERRDQLEREAAEERRRQQVLLAEQQERERAALQKERDEAEKERKRVEAESARKLAELKKAADEQRAKEKAARDELEAKLKAQREADEQRAKQEAEAARKAAAAPDRDKLIAYAHAIGAIDIPDFATDNAKALATTIKASRDKFRNWILEKSEAL